MTLGCGPISLLVHMHVHVPVSLTTSWGVTGPSSRGALRSCVPPPFFFGTKLTNYWKAAMQCAGITLLSSSKQVDYLMEVNLAENQPVFGQMSEAGRSGNACSCRQWRPWPNLLGPRWRIGPTWKLAHMWLQQTW